MAYVRRKVKTGDIEDYAVTSAKLADGAVTEAKIADSFCQAGFASVDSVDTAVSFPAEFPGTPVVVAVGVDVTDVQVTYRSPTHFSWKASSSGNAMWIAIYKP